jgi:hypothetical protein
VFEPLFANHCNLPRACKELGPRNEDMMVNVSRKSPSATGNIQPLQDSVSILPLFRQHFIRYILYSELYLRTCFFCKCRQLLVYSIPASVVELPLFVNLSMNLQCVLLKLGKPVLARDSVG